MPPETTIIGLLAGTVTTLAGVIAYLYRENARAADEREVRLQEKVEEVLRQLVGTVTQLSGTLAAMSDSEKEKTKLMQELAFLARSEKGKG